jgi:hypothetical protein
MVSLIYQILTKKSNNALPGILYTIGLVLSFLTLYLCDITKIELNTKILWFIIVYIILYISVPVIVYFLKPGFFKKMIIVLTATVPGIISLIYLYYCFSRGALLSLFVCLALALFLSINLKWKKVFILCSTVILMLLVILFALKFTDKMAELISQDINLIKDHPLLGVGKSARESVYMSYRPAEYFLRGVAAVRMVHPHNHFLYIASCYGLIALFGWLLLIFYPLSLSLLRFKKNNLTINIISLGIVAMLIHSMFDLVLFMWPLDTIFLLFLGILWKKAWPIIEQQPHKLQLPYGNILKICGAILLLFTGWLLYKNTSSSYFLRKATILKEVLNQKQAAAEYFRISTSIKKEPEFIYKAMLNAHFDLKNQDLTLHYLNMLETETPLKNFAHNHGFKASILRNKNRIHEALPHFRKEVELFPLTAGSWQNLMLCQRTLGKYQEAAISEQMRNKCLEIKGLTIHHLPWLLCNPDYDLEFGKIPEYYRIRTYPSVNIIF